MDSAVPEHRSLPATVDEPSPAPRRAPFARTVSNSRYMTLVTISSIGAALL